MLFISSRPQCVKFGMSSTPAHCSCAQFTGCTAPILHQLNCLCTIHHKVNNNHSLLLISLSIWPAFFVSFLFLSNPISSWSTRRSNRSNVTSFPGCSQIFFRLSQGLLNRSVRKYCRFSALSFRSTWRCS